MKDKEPQINRAYADEIIAVLNEKIVTLERSNGDLPHLREELRLLKRSNGHLREELRLLKEYLKNLRIVPR